MFQLFQCLENSSMPNDWHGNTLAPEQSRQSNLLNSIVNTPHVLATSNKRTCAFNTETRESRPGFESSSHGTDQ